MTTDEIKEAFSALLANWVGDLSRMGSSEEEMKAASAGIAIAGTVVADLHRAADALELIAKHLAPVIAEAPANVAGWITWNGRASAPFEGQVDVMLRDESVMTGHSSKFRWAHIDDAGDIVAYRVP